ncbi:FAD:protein FMN transferase [Jeongeupia sp. USM3]|uniref:FAD:protein FMN transferase n=1 Tax=Jeongeupia sp. USM3 TaxID=1906741 RepID=UPI00089E06EB|nr:FAD:protein FMN transferase [Jeongeupia sp. USM3]AOY00686.1 thiamine biosynthesis protein ApbE [Jeongeupia sp. USM3]
MRRSGALALLAATLLLGGCGKDPLYTQEGYVFGTRVEISIWGLSHDKAATHAAAVLADLDRLNAKLHAWQPSELTRLNARFGRGEPGEADAELIALLKQAKDYEARSDGLFNPAIGGLVTAWGFHRDSFSPVTPDPVTLALLLERKPSLADVEFGDGGRVSSRNPGVALDLGGFAKGWALDREAAYLRKNRVYNALLNIGGNVLALGKKGDAPWTIGLQHPRQPRAMATLALRDGEAIGTSGDYQRYFVKDGRRYSHLIDPRSGSPAQTMQAATVLAPASREAGAISDVATKPVFIGGIGSARHYAQRFGVNDVLVVANDGSVYVTPTLQPRLTWLVQPPHLYWLR